MRVIHLLNHCNHGHGNAHVAVDLACIQRTRGYAVVYASAGGDYEDLLRAYDVELASIVQQKIGSAAAAVGKLVGLLRRFKPDLVHAHMMSGAVIGYAACTIMRVPLVTTVHNSFDTHSVLMRLGHRVVAVSEAERSSLEARGYNPARLDVVINGPNHSPREAFLPDAPRPATRQPCITTVCGLHARKGVDDLLKAFALAAPSCPDWRLNIVGDGPDRGRLQQLAVSLGVDRQTTFFGSIQRPKGVLEASDIFVLASFADPCSLAVAEARDAGCAIIATAVGGTPELLEHGNAGRLVDPGQPEQLAQETARPHDRSETARLGQNSG